MIVNHWGSSRHVFKVRACLVSFVEIPKHGTLLWLAGVFLCHPVVHWMGNVCSLGSSVSMITWTFLDVVCRRLHCCADGIIGVPMFLSEVIFCVSF